MSVSEVAFDRKPVKEDGRLLRGEATRERVLDAAERLFAEHDFDGVSIRQIAQEAGVTLAVVGFHGGSKLDLFMALIRRRAETLSAARRMRLAALTAQGAPAPTLHQLMDSFISPYLEIASAGDPQWRAYAKFIARINDDDRWYHNVRDLWDPVAKEFLVAIEAVHPNVDSKKLATAFVLSVGSMVSLVASRLRIVTLSGGGHVDAVADDILAFRETLIDFCVGGIERAVVIDPLRKEAM
ncbi:TetR/AcrR family transcriptional regulator [Bradyrhizobium manausense]